MKVTYKAKCKNCGTFDWMQYYVKHITKDSFIRKCSICGKNVTYEKVDEK